MPWYKNEDTPFLHPAQSIFFDHIVRSAGGAAVPSSGTPNEAHRGPEQCKLDLPRQENEDAPNFTLRGWMPVFQNRAQKILNLKCILDKLKIHKTCLTTTVTKSI